MASTVEFMLDPSLLDAHLAKLSTDKTLRPSAVELVQALLDLAGSSQAKREGLLLSLAAQLSRKAGLTLEALERAVPMKHQLVLLREMASIQPSSRVVTCNVSRWMLRVHLRGQEGRGFVVDGNDADQAVLTLIALLEQGCVLDGTDDEGGARSRAYLCAISCDLGSWFFNARALQPAEKWLRHSLDLFRKVEEDENGLCEVKEERLTALAIALRMLRVSIPRAPPSPKIEEMGDTGHPSADSKSILGEMASQRPPLLMAAEILRLSDYTERLLKLLYIDNALRLISAIEHEVKKTILCIPWVYRCHIPDMPSLSQEMRTKFIAANLAVSLLGSPPRARSGPQQMGLRLWEDEDYAGVLDAIGMSVKALHMCNAPKEQVAAELELILPVHWCQEVRACLLVNICGDVAKRSYALAIDELESAAALMCQARGLESPSSAGEGRTGGRKRKRGQMEEDGGQAIGLGGSRLAVLLEAGLQAESVREAMTPFLVQGLHAQAGHENVGLKRSEICKGEEDLVEACLELAEGSRSHDALCVEDAALRAVQIAQKLAPGSQHIWFRALSRVPPADLELMHEMLLQIKVASAAAVGLAGDLEGEEKKSDVIEIGRMQMHRSVLMLLCKERPLDCSLALHAVSLAADLGMPKQAIKSCLMVSLSILTKQAEGTVRHARSVNLPSELLEPMMSYLIVATRRADAVICSQMLETPQLVLCAKHCSEFKQEDCKYLWNLPCIEAMTSALHTKGDARRVSWVLKAVERQQLNSFNAENVRASFILKLMIRFVSELLRSYA